MNTMHFSIPLRYQGCLSAGSPRSWGTGRRRHAPLGSVGGIVGDLDVILLAPLGRLLDLLGLLFGDGEVGMDLYVSHVDDTHGLQRAGIGTEYCVRWVNGLR